jgi:hypothetical protein
VPKAKKVESKPVKRSDYSTGFDHGFGKLDLTDKKKEKVVSFKEAEPFNDFNFDFTEAEQKQPTTDLDNILSFK